MEGGGGDLDVEGQRRRGGLEYKGEEKELRWSSR